MPDDPEQRLLFFLDSLKLIASLSFYGGSAIVFVLVVLLCSSALVSASEVAFFSLQKADLSKCTHSKKKKDKHLLSLLSHPQRLLATILIINNLTNIAFVTLSTFLAWEIFGTRDLQGQVLTGLTVLVTVCIVLFGEIIPKIYAAQNPLRYAKSVATPLLYTVAFLRPLTAIFVLIHKQIDKRIDRKGYSYSIDSLQQALDIASKHNTSKEEEDMLRGIMHLSSMPVKEIMQPRHTISALDKEEDFYTLLGKLDELRYSRVPIYNETLDKIEGILYRKDLLAHLDEASNFKWQKFLRSAYFVPENRKIGDLFRDFQKKRVHMAIVVDEYGGTSGLITMEDVIEEIVGDIRDESDKLEKEPYKKHDARNYIFEAKISLNDFCKAMQIPPTFFDELRSESQSLAGLILEIHGKLPQKDTEVLCKNFTFTIKSVDDKRIKSVQVTPPSKQLYANSQ